MQPYRFSPSERTAMTIGEFVEVCQAEPQVAAQHLREGYFEPWLSDAGRRDLAEAATRIRLSGVAARTGLQQFVTTALAAPTRARSRKTSSTAPTPASAQPGKKPAA
jgi:hypothetical protein